MAHSFVIGSPVTLKPFVPVSHTLFNVYKSMRWCKCDWTIQALEYSVFPLHVFWCYISVISVHGIQMKMSLTQTYVYIMYRFYMKTSFQYVSTVLPLSWKRKRAKFQLVSFNSTPYTKRTIDKMYIGTRSIQPNVAGILSNMLLT